ncbi:MAG: T9SS type A sorting domain-containing protein [Calditrichaeota bacterium]|jgi:hypothetical protein|nr:T9SS type A sorting domain-containing protein [Calditrichota bacterium]
MTSTLTSGGDLVYSGRFTDRIAIIKIDKNGELIYERYWDLEEWEDFDDLYCYSIFQNDEYGLSLAGFCGKDELFGQREMLFTDFFLLNTESEPNGIVDSATPNFAPSVCQLYPAFPNPFNSTVTLRYFRKPVRNGELSFFDLQGRMVERLLIPNPSRGTIVWNGNGFPNGEYFVQLKSGGQTSIQRVLLLK